MYCQVIVDLALDRVARPFTYRVPEGMRLGPGQRVRVPFGARRLEGIVLSLEEAPEGIEPEKIREVTAPLEDYAAVPPELMALAQELARESHSPLAETLRLMLPAQMRGGRIKARTERRFAIALSPEEAEEILRGDKRQGKRAQLLRLLQDGAERTIAEIREAVPNPEEPLRKLVKEGLVRVREAEILRRPEGEPERTGDPGFPLTAGQREALEEILPALRGAGGRFLLHGVTGSGKTEVFMAAVRETLALGRSAIILVPEIALTPQMVSWFRGRFGSQAAVIHSRLSAGERYDEWRRIRRGEARLVIGARSAVFSPVERLGLIVVDEEHESTYYSDHRPQYDAREVADSRCRREQATLILASATPSILSFARARRGDYVLLEMPERANRRPLPEVTLVDMRRELEEGNRSIFSRELKRALKACAARGDQAMLLINRRGYHHFVSCRSCGSAIRCPHCDLSLTLHAGAAGGRLKCHYCGYETAMPSCCPSCQSRYIKSFGAGTQQVEEEVHRLLPGLGTVRMDADTTGGKDGHRLALEAFRNGGAQVLIGTQMIARGLDFPRVTLVGIVAADLTLNLPDYRSRERTFQLLTQAAGRAGRGEKGGRVMIQTYRPEDETLLLAARQDYRAFFEDEFKRRRRGLYPPFTILARILAESEKEEAAEEAAALLEQALRERIEARPAWQKKLLLLNRDIPSVTFLRGKHRRQILMKLLRSPEADELLGAAAELLEDFRSRAETRLEINPTNMM